MHFEQNLETWFIDFYSFSFSYLYIKSMFQKYWKKALNKFTINWKRPRGYFLFSISNAYICKCDIFQFISIIIIYVLIKCGYSSQNEIQFLKNKVFCLFITKLAQKTVKSVFRLRFIYTLTYKRKYISRVVYISK